jgi:hypothetical protein
MMRKPLIKIAVYFIWVAMILHTAAVAGVRTSHAVGIVSRTSSVLTFGFVYPGKSAGFSVSAPRKSQSRTGASFLHRDLHTTQGFIRQYWGSPPKCLLKLDVSTRGESIDYDIVNNDEDGDDDDDASLLLDIDEIDEENDEEDYSLSVLSSSSSAATTSSSPSSGISPDLTPGSTNGFFVVKTYNTNLAGFDMGKIMSLVDEGEMDRLDLSLSNISVPVALMMVDEVEYPSISRARKACRKANIMIHRGSLSVDSETGNEIFDTNKCFRARVGDRVFPGDVIAKQVRMGDGYFPIMGHKKPPFDLPVVFEDDHFAIGTMEE